MSFILRSVLALLFIGLAFIIMTQTNETEKYIRTRYGGLRHFALSYFPGMPLPRDLFSNPPMMFYMFIAGMFGLGAFSILFDKKVLMIIFAYFELVCGGLLHIPYDTAALVPQVRKLIFVFAIFLCILAAVGRENKAKEEKLTKNE